MDNIDERFRLIGERIFPLIVEKEPLFAAQIMSRLLDMKEDYLFDLISNRKELNYQIILAKEMLTEKDGRSQSQSQSQLKAKSQIQERVNQMKEKHQSALHKIVPPTDEEDSNPKAGSVEY